ncbi:cytochrome C oxidase subunit IV family protein [Rhizobium sp. BK379]|jgi:nitric oxide reductase NorF protein|uniref:cytochrome C oxidase subunit IV family protein n=1 Tax=Rhizobium sp. BK379 TaxID=2587059 RepID=UPI000DE0BF7C|nr:cytochrome C oxidase subunit IV family protein [Rhizobium sp. BK379]MBB3446935.1 nitric oxide reductase NorF protein [Rhizobium sp. BK379]
MKHSGRPNCSRALLLLFALTGSTFILTHALPNSVPPVLVAVTIAVIAVTKVRLVVLDFLGLRGAQTPLIAALWSWAAFVLLIAVTRAALQLSV